MYHSFARKQAEDNSIIFEEDLDSEGELAVHNVLKQADANNDDFDLDEDIFGI